MARWNSIEGEILSLGSEWIEEEQAYNFSLYSQHAESVTLLLFGEDDPIQPLLEHRLDPRVNKTWHIWHCRLGEQKVRGARYYAYKIDGPRSGRSRDWHAFDPQKVLLDPYAKEVFFPLGFNRQAAERTGSNLGQAPLGILPRRETAFAWGDDRPPRHESEAVIYEMHVRGFTRSTTSGLAPQRRGTYGGVVDKISYLKELGVTMVELLPVQQFDPQEGNYWGYMTLNFFASHQEYATDPYHAGDEFRAMVKALHEADIEVILDVVYNHTAEAGPKGPTYSFRGIDNAAYYLTSDDPRAPYIDYTGCGNTLACSRSAARVLVLESLRYWVTEMHVDGFRFDLASVLARNPDGSFASTDDSLLTAIRTDPILRDVHLIAEPWDAGWAYQLGTRVPRRTLASMERSFPRRRPPFRPGRSRHGRCLDAPAVRQRRPLPGQPARCPAARTRASTTSPATTASRSTTRSHTTRSHNWANGHGNTDGTADN